jgi:CrcB protein
LVLTGQQGLVATTTVNLLGSFLLAFITFGLAQRLALPTWLILGLGTGFVGAFTTWSTLVLETVTLRAIVWFIGNLTLGLACAGCGWALAQVWARRRHEW